LKAAFYIFVTTTGRIVMSRSTRLSLSGTHATTNIAQGLSQQTFDKTSQLKMSASWLSHPEAQNAGRFESIRRFLCLATGN
jgi:hypothetical protein